MALIEVRNLTKTYGEGEARTTVLQDVSFSVDEGEFVALMGPSGSGKSTLLHILGLLERPSEGAYAFDGAATENWDDQTRARMRNGAIGFVFQMFYLLERTAVLENVQLPLVYAGSPRRERVARARQALEAVGMSHRLSYLPSQLSGGEKQRVAIARALVNNPRLILADEPTGNLDSASGKLVMDVFAQLHKERRTTIVLVTHETTTAQYAQRVLRMQDGRIVADEQNDHAPRAAAAYKK